MTAQKIRLGGEAVSLLLEVKRARPSVFALDQTAFAARGHSYDRLERGRDRMNTLAGIVGIAYLLAFGLAVYDRIPISEWLASHLPL